MERDLVELRNKMDETQQKYEEKSKFYGDLEVRIGKNQLEANMIVSEIERVEEVRVGVLEKVVDGKATEKDLSAKSQELGALRMGLKDKNDLIDTFKKILAGSRGDLERLAEDARGSSHSFWFRIFEIERDKVKSEKNNSLTRAYAGMLLSGVQIDFRTFVMQHFQEKFILDISETIDAQKELQKEYLKEERR